MFRQPLSRGHGCSTRPSKPAQLHGPNDIFRAVFSVIRVFPFPHIHPRTSAPGTTCKCSSPHNPQRPSRAAAADAGKGPTEGTSAVNGDHSFPGPPAVQHHIRPVFLYPSSYSPWPLRQAPPGPADSVVLHACPTVYVRCSSETPRPPPFCTIHLPSLPSRGRVGSMGTVVHAPSTHVFPFM